MFEKLSSRRSYPRTAGKSRASRAAGRPIFEPCEERRLMSAVSGTVFNDLNANGHRDSADLGLANQKVFIDVNNNGQLDADSTLSKSKSPHTNIPDAPFGLDVVGIHGNLDSTISVSGVSGLMKTLTIDMDVNHPRISDLKATLRSPSGTEVLLFDGSFKSSISMSNFAGEKANGTWKLHLEDKKFDKTGILNSWKLTLKTGEFSATTNSSGAYTISQSGLAGTFKLRAIAPLGSVFTSPSNGVQTVSIGVQTSGPQPIGGTPADFGIAFKGSIAGNVFLDTNGNGVKNAGDAGRSNVRVFIDANRDGVRQSSETSVLTDSSGNYRFDNVAPGALRIMPDLAAIGGVAVNPSSGFREVTVTSGLNVTGQNFATAQAVTISGKVFEDSNGDSARSTGEAGISGVTVFLDGNNNGTLDAGETSRTTNAAGNYTFGSNLALTPGTYHVRVIKPTGFTASAGTSADVTLASGQVAHPNFGFFHPVSISGTIFHDHDGDGVRDAEDEGVFGRLVFLDANSNGILDAGERSTQARADNTNTAVDETGTYTFSNLRPGTYVVREQLLAGVTSTTGAKTISLFSGQPLTGIDLGELF